MPMAKIFSPIRRPSAPAEVTAPRSPPAAGEPRRDSRVGVQPVTNPPPPGSPALADANGRPTEETWMAMLELVFAETGWPDA